MTTTIPIPACDYTSTTELVEKIEKIHPRLPQHLKDRSRDELVNVWKKQWRPEYPDLSDKQFEIIYAAAEAYALWDGYYRVRDHFIEFYIFYTQIKNNA